MFTSRARCPAVWSGSLLRLGLRSERSSRNRFHRNYLRCRLNSASTSLQLNKKRNWIRKNTLQTIIVSRFSLLFWTFFSPSGGFVELYRISYVWYSLIGSLLCVMVGSLVSLCTGTGQKTATKIDKTNFYGYFCSFGFVFYLERCEKDELLSPVIKRLAKCCVSGIVWKSFSFCGNRSYFTTCVLRIQVTDHRACILLRERRPSRRDWCWATFELNTTLTLKLETRAMLSTCSPVLATLVECESY